MFTIPFALWIVAAAARFCDRRGAVSQLIPSATPEWTDRELSANFDRESSATRVERAVFRDLGAYVNAARHAGEKVTRKR